MRVDLGFQSLQLCGLLCFYQLSFFSFSINKIPEEPESGADENRGAAVKNIIKKVIDKLCAFRIIPDPEKSRQKQFFHTITDPDKTACTQEKYNNRFINPVTVKETGNHNEIVDIKTNDARDKKSDVEDGIL